MPKPKTLRFFFLCILVVGFLGICLADGGLPPGERTVYQIQSWALGAGGSPAAGSGYQSNGTLGQSTPIGVASGTQQVLYAGFWKRLLLFVSGIEPFEEISYLDGLHQNSPNPFPRATQISYSLAREGPVELCVFDASGRNVRTLIAERVPPGIHRISWDGRDVSGVELASGVYFYRMTSGSFVSVRKMLLVR